MIDRNYIEIENLVDFIVDNRGKTVPTSNNGIPLIATNCIKHSSIFPTYENLRFISRQTYDTWFRAHLKPDDILFVNKGTPGRSCIVPEPVNFVAAQDMVGLRFKKEYHPYYMLSVLRSEEIQNTIRNNHVGLAIPHFRKQELVKLKLPIVKKEIRDKIGEIYYILSNKIELNNRINAELEQMAKALYDYWFVQYDFPNAKGKPYKSSGGKMVYNEALKRAIPEGWEVGKLEEVLSLEYGKPLKESDRSGDGYPVLGSNGIVGYHKDYLVKGPGIVVGRKGSAGEITWIDSDFYPIDTTYFVRDNTKSESLIHHYYLLKKIDLKKVESSSAVPGLNRNIVHSFNTEIPATEVIEAFHRIVGPFYKKIKISKQQNQELAALRDWLLPMLINGQVKVGEIGKEYNLDKKQPRIAAEPKTEYKKKATVPLGQSDPRFNLWRDQKGIAARGNIDTPTLKAIFDAMDDEDK